MLAIMPELQLRPFERDQLPLVELRFDDADTQKWLGGPRWPRLALDLQHRPLGEFRGATESGRYRWLAWERDKAIGYIDCGTCDRWTLCKRFLSVVPVSGVHGTTLKPCNKVAISAASWCFR
jgi:hypothetical protein